MSGKRALVTGITGQDGSYLAELLLDRGYEVHGLVRASTPEPYERLAGISERLTLHRGDLTDQHSLQEAFLTAQPDEIYNLAAMSSVADSWREPILTAELTGVSVARLLEAMREVCPEARFYQASSSEMFGNAREMPQNERTPLYPRSPYGLAKAYGHLITVNYRESYGLYACSGILYNHESPRRGLDYVTRKVTRGVAAIKLGISDKLVLGDLEARRDWGFAGDYVEAIWAMLQRDVPDDYVIGTGHSHSVRDLIAVAFGHAGLDSDPYIQVDESLLRPADANDLVADPSKVKRELGWEASMGFEELIGTMVDADLEALGRLS